MLLVRSSMMPSDPLSDVLALLRPAAYAFRGVDVGGEWSLHLPADEVVRCYAPCRARAASGSRVFRRP